MHFMEKYKKLIDLYTYDLFQFQNYYKECVYDHTHDQEYIELCRELENFDNEKLSMEQSGKLSKAHKLMKKLEKIRYKEDYASKILYDSIDWLNHQELLENYSDIVLRMSERSDSYSLLMPLRRSMDDYIFGMRKYKRVNFQLNVLKKEMERLKSPELIK